MQHSAYHTEYLTDLQCSTHLTATPDSIGMDAGRRVATWQSC